MAQKALLCETLLLHWGLSFQTFFECHGLLYCVFEAFLCFLAFFYNSKSISVQFHLILVITVNEKAKCMHAGDLIFNWTNIGNSFKVHIAYRLISVGQNLFHVKGNIVFLSKSCNFRKTTKILLRR